MWHEQPTVAVLLDQGRTYRCGPYTLAEWFAALNMDIRPLPVFQSACGRADNQGGYSFADERDCLLVLSETTQTEIRLFNGDGFVRDFATFDQLVRDKWCVAAGVWEGDLIAGQLFYHWMAVDGLDWDAAGPHFHCKDPYWRYDGEEGWNPIELFHRAMQDNWDPLRCAIAWRFDAA